MHINTAGRLLVEGRTHRLRRPAGRALYAGCGVAGLLCLAILLLRPAASNRPQVSPLPGIAIGSVAPDFALADLHGGRVQLSRLEGRRVLLNFWGVTCPPCRSEMPALEQAFTELSRQGVAERSRPVELGVDGDLDSTGAVERFVSSLKIGYPILVDSTLSVMTRYHVGELPTSLLVDPRGRVSAVYIGPMSRQQILRALRRA